MRKMLLPAACTAALLAGAAMAQPTDAPREASIPFANHGGIYNWQAVDRDTLYVQDVHRQWYRAGFIGPCRDLDFAEATGFKVDAGDRFDRFSEVIVRGQRCALNSLVESGPPPKRANKPKG